MLSLLLLALFTVSGVIARPAGADWSQDQAALANFVNSRPELQAEPIVQNYLQQPSYDQGVALRNYLVSRPEFAQDQTLTHILTTQGSVSPPTLYRQQIQVSPPRPVVYQQDQTTRNFYEQDQTLHHFFVARPQYQQDQILSNLISQGPQQNGAIRSYIMSHPQFQQDQELRNYIVAQPVLQQDVDLRNFFANNQALLQQNLGQTNFDREAVLNYIQSRPEYLRDQTLRNMIETEQFPAIQSYIMARPEFQQDRALLNMLQVGQGYQGQANWVQQNLNQANFDRGAMLNYIQSHPEYQQDQTLRNMIETEQFPAIQSYIMARPEYQQDRAFLNMLQVGQGYQGQANWVQQNLNQANFDREAMLNYIQSRPEYQQDQTLRNMIETEQFPAIQSYIMARPAYQQDQALLNMLQVGLGYNQDQANWVQQNLNQGNFDREALRSYIMSRPEYQQDQTLRNMIETEHIPAIQSYIMARPEYQQDQALLNMLQVGQGYNQGYGQRYNNLVAHQVGYNQDQYSQALQGQLNDVALQSQYNDQALRAEYNNVALQGQYNDQLNIDLEALHNYILSRPEYRQDQTLRNIIETEQIPAIQSYIMARPEYQQDRTLLNMLNVNQGQVFDVEGLRSYIQSRPEYAQDQTLWDVVNSKRPDVFRSYIMSRPQYQRDQRLVSFVINIRIHPTSPVPSILPIVEPSILPIAEPSILPIQENVQPEILPVARPAVLSAPVESIQSLISQRPEFGQIVRTCNVPGRLALTFDDGPLDYTPQLLDVLRNEGVRATFFVVGGNSSPNWSQLVRRIFQEGHQVASHTISHVNLDALRTEERQNQMEQNDALIRAAIGVSPTYMRPPYGECNADCLSDITNMGYRIINYNVDTNDWQGDMAASRAEYLGGLQSSSPQSDSFIALAHDIHPNAISELVPYMIQQARALGYQFSTVGECLGEDQANWYRGGQGQGLLFGGQPGFVGGVQESSAPGQGAFIGNQDFPQEVSQDIVAY